MRRIAPGLLVLLACTVAVTNGSQRLSAPTAQAFVEIDLRFDEFLLDARVPCIVY